jgi:hypothetical protein
VDEEPLGATGGYGAEAVDVVAMPGREGGGALRDDEARMLGGGTGGVGVEGRLEGLEGDVPVGDEVVGSFGLSAGEARIAEGGAGSCGPCGEDGSGSGTGVRELEASGDPCDPVEGGSGERREGEFG